MVQFNTSGKSSLGELAKLGDDQFVELKVCKVSFGVSSKHGGDGITSFASSCIMAASSDGTQGN